MKRLLHRRIILGLLLLIGILAVVSRFGQPQKQEEVSIPLPDLSAAHTKVAAELKRLQNEIIQDPSSSTHWGELGMVLMIHEWNTEAISAFETALQLDPQEVRWAYLQAMLLEVNDLNRSAEVYSQAATINPNYAPLRYRWAQVLMRLDQTAAAEEQLRAASQMAPQSPYPPLALGRAAIAREDYPAALGFFQQAAGVAPYCREAREQLARTHFLLGDQQQAERDQQQAYRLPPVYPGFEDPILQEVNQHELVVRQSAERADQLAASGDMAAAIAAFQQLIKDRPDLSRPRLNLATLFAMQGDMQTAAEIYREIIKLFPNEALAHQGLGAVLERTGNVGGAISAYRESIRLKPDFAQAHHALGRLWEQSGNLDLAISSYRQGIAADARFAPAHLSLGMAWQKKGKLEEAVAAMENAVRLAPNDAVPLCYLERARQQMNENRQDESGKKK